MQLSKYENQTLEAFVVVASRLSAKLIVQKFSLLATSHDCETGLYEFWSITQTWSTTELVDNLDEYKNV